MRYVMLLCGLAAVPFLTGCEVQPIEAAPLGSAPEPRVAVGPVPGPVGTIEYRSSPYTRNKVALREGRQLFVWYNCAGCHGGHGGGGMGPSLRDEMWIYGSSDAHIFDSVSAGRAHGMPAWGYQLPEQQIWKIVSYIDSMGTEYEPSPPKVPQPSVNVPDWAWPESEQ